MGLFFDSKREKEQKAAANKAREAKRVRWRKKEQKNLADAERRIKLYSGKLKTRGRGDLIVDMQAYRHMLREAENSRDTAKYNLKGLG